MQLKAYQDEAIHATMDWILGKGKPGKGLWLDMGMGKTAVMLHVFRNLRFMGLCKRMLVIAPRRVVDMRGWENEIAKWGLSISVATIDSNAKARKHPFADRKTKQTAELIIISCDSIPWLLKHDLEFDLLVVDEATKFKNWSSKRTKALRRLLLRCKFRATLTGTPIPNSLLEIFPQQFILDDGETLGSKITHFRNRYAQRCGFELRDWEIRPEMVEPLQDLISPWYLHQDSMTHLDLPPRVDQEIPVHLDDKSMEIYRDVQRQMFAEMQDTSITALTGSTKYLMLRQITGGAVYYDEDRNYSVIHSAKVDMVEDLMDEINRPLMVAYCFRHEMDRLRERFPKIRAINGDTSSSESVRILKDWQAGKIPILAVQPQALSHGVDGLQHGGNDLIWFTVTDRPEDRMQLEKRLHRLGAQRQVNFYYLLVPRTVDETVKRTLERKGATQNDLLRAIRDQAGREAAGDSGADN